MTQGELLGLLFLAIGAGVIAIGMALRKRARRFLDTAVAVQGEVIALLKSSSAERFTYVPKIRFTTPEGQPFEFTDSTGTNPPQHRLGDPIAVIYPRGRPEAARVAGWFGVFFVPTIVTAIGAIAAISGLGAYITGG